MVRNNSPATPSGSWRPTLLISLISAALVFSSLGVSPANANTNGAGSARDVTTENITQLIVSYEKGISPRDSNGDPTGQQIMPDVDLNFGSSIGNGLFTVRLPEPVSEFEAAQLSKSLANSPLVAVAQPDLMVELFNTTASSPTSTQIISDAGTWGLDRIDQRSLPLDFKYTYGFSGLGIKAYIIDSGIYPNNDFGNRILPGFSAISDSVGTSDCSGHGTHVAGIVGGSTFGVAKQVNLVPVRVFPCATTTSSSNIIAGINWVIADHKPGEPAVANMSLGGGYNYLLDQAVRNLIADGVNVIVASGNDSLDACDFTPASTLGTITVNASTSSDNRASFSNFGSCTDIFAPGQGILSAGIANATSRATKDGTSMATPFVSGVVVKILEANTSLTTSQVATILLNSASTFSGSDKTGDPTRILFSLSDEEINTAVNEQVVAAETARLAQVEQDRLAGIERQRLAAIEAERLAGIERERLAQIERDAAASAAAAAEAVRLASAPVVQASLLVTPLKKKRLSISVAAPAGSKTTIQRKVGKKWKNVKTTVTVPSLVTKVSRSGTYRVQITIPTGTITTKSYKVK